MKTAILTDPRYHTHNDFQHVERAERLWAIEKALEASGLLNDLLAIPPRAASESELKAVHSPNYLETIQRFSQSGGGYLDPDTYMNSASWEAAVWAAGGVVRAVEAVSKGECQNAFALVRPPGHHATPKRAMGFCLINNVAVAARYAHQVLGLERVAIVDFDVHHGNGTQDIFYSDPHVLYCSTHLSPFYPGTGSLNEVGSGTAVGATLNLPLPSGVGDEGYEKVFEQVLLPALRHWKPQLILVSAGYDAHWSDPLGLMLLSVNGYARLTQLLVAAATELCAGRLVMALEGGYNLDALGACVVAAFRVLLGRSLEKDSIGAIDKPGPDLQTVIANIHKRHPLFAQA